MPSTDKPIRGVVPIAPTPFRDNGDLDLDSQRRVFDCMIDQGVDGICILANYSEQFLLSDEERSILLDLALSQVRGRVPVIVTCSHFSTRIAAERAPAGGGRRCRHADAHAALPRGALAGRRSRHLRTLCQGRRGCPGCPSWCRTPP